LTTRYGTYNFEENIEPKLYAQMEHASQHTAMTDLH